MEDEDLNKIIEYGEEYGSTTGRKRLVNWLNLDKMIQAICLSGCTEVIINKCDVLEKLGKFKLTYQNKLIEFKNMHAMKEFIADTITCGMNGNDLANNDVYEVTFSASKEVLV